MAQAQAHTQDRPCDPAIERFLKFLKKNELPCENYELSRESNKLPLVSNGLPFVCINAVRTYLDGKSNNREPLEELLHGLYQGADEKPNAGTILSSDQSYVAILCILIMLEKGNLINRFVTSGLHDGKLPLSFESPPPKDFPRIDGDGDFYRKFCRRQWMFCVPHFIKAKENDFDNDQILPITKKTLVGGGGSADVYEIQIHACYNRLHDNGRDSPRKKCPSTSDETQDETSNVFVLKTYTTPSAPKDYDNEKKAYQKLGENNVDERYIINFYGNFTHNDTCNIILERADKGSLEDYFEKYTPPSESEHIRQFWENLFQILIALHNIHHVEQKLYGLPKVSKGWHQDVKPANILVFNNNKSSPYEFTFKLGDFGTSHFKKIAEVGVQGTATDSYGTVSYGAPECYRSEGWEGSPLHVTQKVDVWSFGCILSEAAVWVNNGYRAGVWKYRRELSEETSKNPRLGTSFHNVTKVCETVFHWHNTVRKTIRKSDNTTIGVLEHVETYMLLMAPGRRMDPHTQWSWVEGLLRGKQAPGMAAMSPNFPGPQSNTDGILRHPPAPPALPNDVQDITPSDREIDRRKYPHTYKYHQEQDQTSKKCNEILSLISKGEKSLGERDPAAARVHFKDACKAVPTLQESKNPPPTLAVVIFELYVKSWTGMVKCELAIIDQAHQSFSSDDMKAHRKSAEYYAKGAFEAEKRIDPGSSTCEALELLKGRWEIR